MERGNKFLRCGEQTPSVRLRGQRIGLCRGSFYSSLSPQRWRLGASSHSVGFQSHARYKRLAMKLEPTQKYKTLYEFYSPSDWPPPWRVRIERMLALVVYLENEINYPSMLATHSHENLVLSIPGQDWILSATPTISAAAPKDTIYKLRWRVDKPWSYIVAYAASLEDVGKIVRAAISGEIHIPSLGSKA